MAFFENDGADFIPLAGTLTSFGSPADGKIVKRSPFTLEGNTGSGWATIAADKYFVRRSLGRVELRDIDDSDNLLDWSAYTAYQDLGNDAVRATYTVKVQAGTTTTYTQEVIEIAEIDAYQPFTESGEIDGELPQNLWVQEIHAEFGDIGGWNIDDDQIWADNNKAIINSATPFISLGNLVNGYMDGKGFWVGKHVGDWKFHVGDPAAQYLNWDGTDLWDTGKKIGGLVAGWTVTSTQISADNGKAIINSATPFISLGNLVNGYFDGKGFWVGKHAGDWKFHIGDPAAEYLQWDGTNLYHTGNQTAGTVGGLTNGWKVKAGYIESKNAHIRLDANSEYFGIGNPAPTTYLGATGFWVGDSGGTYAFHLGNPAGSHLKWDGTTLAVTGTITSGLGQIGGWTIGASTLTATNVSLDSSGQRISLGSSNDIVILDADDGTYRIWTGHATAASAPFRVTKAGALTATGATITGAITATSGAIGGFDIGADYLRDAADTFGLASTVSAGNDVRFWAGAAFASRASAPLQIYEDGYIFAKDIVLAKGNLTGASGVTGYGYAVGDPLLLLHFDGAKPFELDTRGSLIGHKGQAGTWTWGGTQGRGMFRPGKFNKAVEIAEATTNLISNPSWEVDQTGWSVISGTFATNARTTNQNYTGFYSNALVNSSGSNAILSHDFTANAATSTISIWFYRLSGTGTVTLYLQEDFAPFTVIGSVNASSTTGVWQRLVVTGATTSTSVYRLRVDVATGVTCYLDSAQAEGKAYVTPYCDGYMSADGHSWSGTAHASTSSRTASLLTYPSSGNFLANQGTLSLWYYEPGNTGTFASLFGWRIDANNYFALQRTTSTAVKPYIETASGGVSASTGTGGAAQAEGWHYLVATWSNGGGAGSLKLYIDGAQYGSTTAAYVTPSGTVPALEIGSFNSTGHANTVIDELCILAYVLSLNEIKSIYYSEAPLMVGISSQEFRLAGVATGDVFGNANGLFARGADGSPSFGLMNATVNATTWGGASESFDAGDFMFGSNKASKSNLFWDASTGKLNFRGATTTQLYVGTDGSLNFGGGAQILNADGFTIAIDESYSAARAITWKDGSSVVTSVWMEGSLGGGYENLNIEVEAPAGYDANIYLTATPGSGASDASIFLNTNGITYDFSALRGAAFDQGTQDSHILRFLSTTDVTHGMTDETETNVYGAFRKADGDAGGLDIRGFRDASGSAGNALRLRGHLGEAADTTKSASALAVIDLDASVKSGTGITGVGANGNLVVIRNNASARFIFDAEGDGHYDGAAWAGYDAHDDIALLNMLNHFLLARQGVATMDDGAATSAGEKLKALKIVSPNPESSPFVNQTKLQALSVGAIRQIGEQITRLSERLAKVESQMQG